MFTKAPWALAPGSFLKTRPLQQAPVGMGELGSGEFTAW